MVGRARVLSALARAVESGLVWAARLPGTIIAKMIVLVRIINN
jgi:hypothetical protein